ncbi:MAG: DinB family protein [Dehalococcoidia bacterium]
MDAVDLIRKQYKGAHDLLEVTMKDVTDEQAHWAPPGIANPLGATYFHVVGAEDFLLSARVRGTQPLAMGGFAGKAGVSEPPPGPGPGIDEWMRRVKVDLAQVRAYAQAVYKQTDDWLATLSADELDKPMDMSTFGMGEQPISTLVAGIIIQHINNHLGEISCLKGMQGAKGYPF